MNISTRLVELARKPALGVQGVNGNYHHHLHDYDKDYYCLLLSSSLPDAGYTEKYMDIDTEDDNSAGYNVSLLLYNSIIS